MVDTPVNQTGFKLKGSRGRPKGSQPQPRPKTVAEFVHLALAAPLAPPPPQEKPPRKRSGNGVWGKFKTPEERQAYARHLASLRKPENMARTNRRTGTPNGWKGEQARAVRALAELEADRLVAHLRATGAIAKDDAEAAKATKDALVLVRSPGGSKRRRKMAERLLAHYHPELAAKPHA